MPKLETWSAPTKPLRGGMVRAKVALNHIDGMARLDLRASVRYQDAWVIRERSIMGTPLNIAWRTLEREHTIVALRAFEALVDALAPGIDTREYAPDTTREIKRDARESVLQGRKNSGRTDSLPRTDNVETSKPVFYLAQRTDLTDTLGQSSVDAMHGVSEKVSRDDAYEIVRHCVALAKAGDVRTLTNTLRVSRDVLSAYGFYGTLNPLTHRYNGVLGNVYAELGHVGRRDLAKGLKA